MVIANPRQMQMIAHAKIKTDTIDATVLAKLYASNFLPEVWVADARTLALRRQVTRRNQIVRQRARLKTIAQSILHAHLVPQCPHADLFGIKGRAWLLAQRLPEDEREAVERHVREYDRIGDDLRVVERELARDALSDADVKRLMTIPGIDMVVAVGLTAAIGTISRFKRGNHIAAVAVARKLAVIIWHLLQKGEDYSGVRPALHAKKLRDLELRSGQPARRGQRGSTYEYSLTRSRLEDKRRAEQAEIAYRRLTEGWTKRGRRAPTSAANEERR